MSGANRNEVQADPERLAQLTRWAQQPPRSRTLRIASAASSRYELTAPEFGSELGAHCHAVAMSGLVNGLADLLCGMSHTTREKVA